MSAEEKAVDVALEIAKQIIAISTAILALTGVFFEKLEGMTGDQRTLLAATWGVFFLAVFLGLVAFMISAGALAGKTGLAVVKRWDLRIVSALQIIAFFVAVLLMLIFAFSRLSSTADKSRQRTPSAQEKTSGMSMNRPFSAPNPTPAADG
jgi:hypothetical protein